MELKLFNSLSKQKEIFVPINPENITMYVCGPTVYDRPHLGNARSVVIYDLLFRLMLKLFPKVTYVRNITDVDDKINAAASARKIPIQKLTAEILDYFYQDTLSLNVLPPTFEPKATSHINDMIEMIKKLIDQGNAYVSSGHVLFDVNSYKNYGQLSNRSLEDMIAGARVEIADYKKNPLDFVLWKPAAKDDDRSSIFGSPWGLGRPGWHIECSAMSNKFLGDNFDIHGGGADLQFPHHENEIAQSKCANSGSMYAKYWVHNGFLTVDGEKMSKSLNNFFTIYDLLNRNISGVAIRYLLLSTHYRKPLDFNEKSLFDAEKSIEKFYNVILENKILDDRHVNEKTGLTTSSFELLNNENNSHLNQIMEYLSDDLNTPLAFSVLHDIVKLSKASVSPIEKTQLVANLIECLDFLGLYDVSYFARLQNHQLHPDLTPELIDEQIELRKQAKANKDWIKADAIRTLLLEKNIVLEDIPDGVTKWSFKK